MLANDGGRFYEENKNYVTKIHVFLKDVNDNDPVFLNAPYTVDIMENQTDIVFVYKVCRFPIPVAINVIYIEISLCKLFLSIKTRLAFWT